MWNLVCYYPLTAKCGGKSWDCCIYLPLDAPTTEEYKPFDSLCFYLLYFSKLPNKLTSSSLPSVKSQFDWPGWESAQSKSFLETPVLCDMGWGHQLPSHKSISPWSAPKYITWWIRLIPRVNNKLTISGSSGMNGFTRSSQPGEEAVLREVTTNSTNPAPSRPMFGWRIEQRRRRSKNFQRCNKNGALMWGKKKKSCVSVSLRESRGGGLKEDCYWRVFFF